MLEHQFEHAGDPERSHAMYSEDAVIEFPQSGERFEGVENFREWRSRYPAETRFEIGEIRGGGDVWVVELTVTYDDTRTSREALLKDVARGGFRESA
jgi:ketosteroid isomerase-like protein